MMETTVNIMTQGKMMRNRVMRMKNQMKRKRKMRRIRIKMGLMKTLKMKKKVTVISLLVSSLLI